MIDIDAEINPYNVFLRGTTFYNKFSTRIGDVWGFDDPRNYKFIIEKEGVNYYKISVPFGLVESKQSNPSKYSYLGEPGDVVAIDRNFTFVYISKDKFNSYFPGILNL
jgi:hypothetical protein